MAEHRTHRLAAVVLLAVAGAAASACSAKARDVPVVKMTDDLRYAPEKLTIRKGQTVRWENVSRFVHTVTADANRALDPQHVLLPEGAAPFDSGSIEPQQSYSRVFDVTGRYRYFCIPHELAGMLGELVVEP